MPTSFDVQLAELHASAQDVLVSGSMNQACRMIAAELELLSSERGVSSPVACPLHLSLPILVGRAPVTYVGAMPPSMLI